MRTGVRGIVARDELQENRLCPDYVFVKCYSLPSIRYNGGAPVTGIYLRDTYI